MAEGKFDDAEPCFLSAELLSKELPDDDRRRGTSLHNLADLRRAQGHVREAIDLYRRGLAILEQSPEAPEREIGVLLGGYAIACAADDRLAESEQLLRRAIEVNERVRGVDDEEVASNLRNLAAVVVAQGHLAEATGYATRAAAIRSKGGAPQPATSRAR
jgi:tetratricopeptide (TPR) repeat protein